MSDFNDLPEPAGDPDVPEEAPDADMEVPPTPPKGGKRKLTKEKKPKKKRPVPLRVFYWFIGLLTLSVLAYGGFYGYLWWKAEHAIPHSNAIASLHNNSGKGMDLLIMGLDTRRNEKNKPVPTGIYNALHLGDSDKGQNDTNVLMYIHIPADHSKAVAISIPRDDWVDIPNCVKDPKQSAAQQQKAYDLRQFVGSNCKAKIKQAYGFALAAAQQEGMSWQDAKNAARLEEVETVQNFLNVKISSFVEVTMVAFFQMAQAIGKVQVCVKEATHDQFSGANFKQGLQWINASQAVAFVRQRRDPNNPTFTDLDRARRQQAFIVSLLTQMKSAGTLLDPFKINDLIDVAGDNVVLSDGLDVINLAKLASNLSGNNIKFYTLPVVAFGSFQAGPGQPYQDANQVNVPEIQAIVKSLLSTGAVNIPKPSSSPSKKPSKHHTKKPAKVPTTVSATGGGSVGPAPQDLTALSGGGIPCVK